MSETIFFRLLKTPVDDKAAALLDQVATLQNGSAEDGIFTRDVAAFSSIDGSPFPYWAPTSFLQLFSSPDRFETDDRIARVGLGTTDDYRFLRVFWEIPADRRCGVKSDLSNGAKWVSFAKGGIFSPFHSDLHVVLNWESEGHELRQYIRGNGDSPSRRISSESLYFYLGLTWPLRASRFAPYAMPKGSVFGVRGYAIIASETTLPMLLAILNSRPFDQLFKLYLGRSGYPEFVVGVLQKLPWIQPNEYESAQLQNLGEESYQLRRAADQYNEVTNAFCLPSLVLAHGSSVTQSNAKVDIEIAIRARRIESLAERIDTIVYDLFAVPSLERLNQPEPEDLGSEEQPLGATVDDDAGEAGDAESLHFRVANVVMWSVGILLGRWDIRCAIDSRNLPNLQGPFDPLPRCSPAPSSTPPASPPPATTSPANPGCAPASTCSTSRLPTCPAHAATPANTRSPWPGTASSSTTPATPTISSPACAPC